MLFHSATFVVFFAAVFLIYWRLEHRAQNHLLLAASMLFYGSWNYQLLPLIVASASIDYCAGIFIHASEDQRRRKALLLLSLCSNLGLLGVFKYYDFFVESFNELMGVFGLSASVESLSLILPVGISFYTFQSMSYTIDVYRGKLEPCRQYLDFLLYVSFFPQLVAGPIERAVRLLPAVQKPRRPLSTTGAVDGIKLICVGYFQKVAVADVMASIVDAVYTRPADYDSLTILMATYAFAIQIYCDFSGYSKIARGTARLLGFELMINFQQPYFATTVTEFWRRWHISLSTWLRDYLYIPLGGNRKGTGRTYVNLLITMLLGGLWHGASWNFVIWGGLHGGYLAVHKFMLQMSGGQQPRVGPLRRWLSILATFHLVVFTWVFFRSSSWETTKTIFSQLGKATHHVGSGFATVALYGLVTLALDAFLERHSRSGQRAMLTLFSRRWALETAAVTLLVLVTMFIGTNDEVPFLYFQF